MSYASESYKHGASKQALVHVLVPGMEACNGHVLRQSASIKQLQLAESFMAEAMASHNAQEPMLSCLCASSGNGAQRRLQMRMHKHMYMQTQMLI